MRHLVFFLEEPSAREMLRGLLPRLQQNPDYRCVVFEGKQDLENNLVRKMRAYRVPDSHFIVLRDQDAADCLKVKSKLAELCKESQKENVLVRVACHELESWYLADLKAVEKGLQLSGIARLQNKSKYRMPDSLPSPSIELERLTRGLYQKVSGSRAIGPYLDSENDRSNSFRVFVDGIRSLLGNETP